MTSPYRALAAVLRYTQRYDRWTRKEFTEGTGLTRSTAERMITMLHRQRVFRIDEWVDDTTGRSTVAVYTFGSEPDAKRRKAMTTLQRTRAYQQRKKQRALDAIQKAVSNFQVTGEESCQ